LLTEGSNRSVRRAAQPYTADDMSDLERFVRQLEPLEQVQLRKPIAVLGFGGWIDAGFAATGAVRYLVDQLPARRIAELDPEPFYSFTDTRPRVRVRDGWREPEWPLAEWFVVHMPEEAAHDLVLFTGPEPNLRWQTFTGVMLDLLQQIGTETIVSLGAVLAPVHHRARVSLRGRGTTEELRLELRRRHIGSGNYQGPTGITTVLLVAAQERGLPGLSLSASSPSYLANVPNPRTSAALLRAVAEINNVALPLGQLERDSRALMDQVDQSIASQPELREALERLSESESAEQTELVEHPAVDEPPPELPSSAAVLRDLEDFLRTLREKDQQ
jgi:proteasome assembly chaperone (PAC2) family protein